jgi:LPXTG-motif cell wall-anchored protein
MTVGLVVAGAVIVVGVVLWLRKRRRNKAVLPMAPEPAFQYPDKAYAQAQPVSYPVGDPHAHFSELQTVPPCYELPEKR